MAPEPVPTGPPLVMFDEASAQVEDVDAYSTTEVDKNGIHRVTLSHEVVNVNIDGQWVPASAELTPDASGALHGEAHPLELTLAPTADDPSLIHLDRDGYSVSFALKGAVASRLERVDVSAPPNVSDAALYRDVFDGADLRYDVSPSALKESIILKEPPADGGVAYTWTVTAPGLELVRNEFGDLEFLDPEGAVVYAMPLPAMWDSLGTEGVGDSAAVNVDYDVVPVSDGAYEITLLPDAAWLRDPARVYPVTVDPTLSAGAYYLREYKQGGFTSTTDVKVGNTQESSTCCAWISIVQYNYSSIMSKQVTYALLSSSRISGTVNCYGGGVYTPTVWAYDFKPSTYLASFANCATGGADQSIYQQIGLWMKAGNTGGALAMTGTSGNVYSYKALSTVLQITYVDAPAVTGIAGDTPHGGVTGVALPVMEATGTFYAGSVQYFKYTFTSTDGGAPYTSPFVVGAPFHVPDGKLTPGKHYTYTITTSDNYPSSPEVVKTNADWHFTMGNPPSEPTNVTVDGQALTANLTATSLRPTLCATVADADGGAVRAMFTLKYGPITVADSVAGDAVVVTPTTSGVSCAVVPYDFSGEGGYTISVTAFDEHLSSSVFEPPYTVTGLVTGGREIPGTWDSQTGASS